MLCECGSQGGVPKVLYVVRHCAATGQEPPAPLTEEGRAQAEALCAFLSRYPIERIVSSPFRRARESILPLGKRLGLEVETDKRLRERTLSTVSLPDWREQLRCSFQDLDRAVGGGESSRQAMGRAEAALGEIVSHPAWSTAVVTHGNWMALALKLYDRRVGFEEWVELTYPDVYRVMVRETPAIVGRIWMEENVR